MSARVTSPGTVSSRTRDGVVEHELVGPDAVSALALSLLAVPAGAGCREGDDDLDTLLFAVAGAGTLDGGSGTVELAAGTTVLVPAGGSAELTAGAGGIELVRCTVGPGCDLHAPMGPPAAATQLESVEPGKATGARSFQVLFDASNGSTRATLFVGHIPPGKAPWHYHLYDEIVWVLAGEGRLHLDGGAEALSPGCAFRLRPREVHIVENTLGDRELSVLGLFTPAGSPSAAYLEPGVFAEYVATSG